MSAFFERVTGGSANPFATQVGQLIEQATDGSLASENWALNMEICDVINETDEGPKDAIKALKKRLSTNVGKNYQVVMYSLTVLESAVKNCGRRFHAQVATKDFLGELIKIIGPKNDPPQAVQEKVLSLIQTWADAFKGVSELKEVEKQYYDLKKKGIEFPMTDLDKMAPIHTPARSAPGMDPPPPVSYPPQRLPSSRHTAQQQQQMMVGGGGLPAGGAMVPTGGSVAPVPVPVQAPTGPITLNQEQLTKLNSELETVQQNCKVFNEMLTEMTPGQEDASDLELLQELNRTCRQMQQRIVELLDRVANEEVTSELLRVNDDLNNAFLRYERFERYRTGQAQGAAPRAQTSPGSNAATLPLRPPGAAVPPANLSAAPASASSGEAGAAPAPAPNLIDFDLSPQPPAAAQATENPFAPVNASDISVQLASMNVGTGSVSQQLGEINSTPAASNQMDEFDMFAQSRQSFDTSKTNPVADSYSAGEQRQVNASLGTAAQLKNVSDKPTDLEEMEKWLEENTGVEGQESATSAEFDKFLAERAKEADNLPDLPSAAGNNSANSRRQMQKDDQENAMFAL